MLLLGLNVSILMILVLAVIYIVSAIIGINYGRKELKRDLEFYRDSKDIEKGFYLTTLIYSFIPVLNTIMLIFYGLFELRRCNVSLSFIMKLFNLKE